MQRISTWTVFKGEPVCFQAGSEGCSCTPGTDVPLSLNAMMHPAHELLALAALAIGARGAACDAKGHRSSVSHLWFLGFPLQGDDNALFPW